MGLLITMYTRNNIHLLGLKNRYNKTGQIPLILNPNSNDKPKQQQPRNGHPHARYDKNSRQFS